MTIVNAVIESLNREPETYELLTCTDEWHNLKRTCVSKGWRGYGLATILGEDWKTYQVMVFLSQKEWKQKITEYQSKGYTVKAEVME